MKVLKAKVEWMFGWANSPKLQMLVDAIPGRDDMRYERKVVDGGVSLWYAEKDGYVSFFCWEGPGDEGGYGGREFAITTTDGEKVVLKGPWSSRAGAMNLNGFGPCVDVELTDDHEAFERGHTFYAEAVTLELAEKAAALAGIRLERAPPIYEHDREPVWVPAGKEEREAKWLQRVVARCETGGHDLARGDVGALMPQAYWDCPLHGHLRAAWPMTAPSAKVTPLIEPMDGG